MNSDFVQRAVPLAVTRQQYLAAISAFWTMLGADPSMIAGPTTMTADAIYTSVLPIEGSLVIDEDRALELADGSRTCSPQGDPDGFIALACRIEVNDDGY